MSKMLENLYKAEQYYSQYFDYINAPWEVPEEVIAITCNTNKGSGLVGSGEQSFIELMLRGELEEGNYYTCTPCYRPEDATNRYREKMFIKIELIKYLKVCPEELVHLAGQCFEHLVGGGEDIKKVYTSEGIDILYKGVEIGSYGVRAYKKHYWTYGTGIAEPRLSRLMEG